MNPETRAPLARKLSFAVIRLLLVLALLEGSFRILSLPFLPLMTPSETSFGRFDETLGWSYVPDWCVAPRGAEARLCFDETGIRVASREHRLDPARQSVLLIGGELTLGDSVPYEESLAGQLARERDLGLQPVNLGVSGFGTDQALLRLEQMGGRFDTRVVVYTFRRSHLRRNLVADRRSMYPYARFPGTKPRFELRGGDLVLAESPLRLGDRGEWRLVQTARLLGGAFRSAPVELTRALLERMDRAARSMGARLIVVHWSDDDGGGDDSTRALLEGLDAPVLETADDAPADWTAWVSESGQPTGRAYAHVAGRIARTIESLEGVEGIR